MPLRHLLLVFAVCVMWAINFLTSAIALKEFPPLLFTALRFAPLALLLIPWMKPPARGQWPRLIAVALCIGVLHFGLSFWALQLAGNLSSPAILMQSYIPMSAVLAVIVLGERVGWRTWSGIGVSFLGVLVLGFDPIVLQAPMSMALMLVSAFFLALGTVLMRRLSGVNAFAMQGWTAVFAFAPLLLWSAVVEHGQMEALRTASWAAWGGVVYAALLSSLFGHGLFYWLVQRHPVSTLTPYLLLTPVIAIGLGIMFWGDEPGPRLYLGGAMVLAGVLVISVRAKQKARPVPEPADV
ncbi:DMT family transporter [Chiayiivirga flava]|uniref:O-acetylserine/cysteine efflux transporter n=1 Tax=Chiayiivirga flava TaxID=659595 RepID=A0A7W8D6F9_9GAMM|nr:DMT family transporter [Chiayiivirga flava]MBB5207586.1 O-acetylserine/cysteine efflux transporter [Chiayiivirga flava]